MSKPHRKIFAAVLILIALIGIGDFLLLIDCAWIGSARTWIDQNQNGIWEDNEIPLAGVSLTLLYKGTKITDFSDQTGETGLAFRYSCGIHSAFIRFSFVEIHAVPPPGYEPTTPSEIKVRFGNRGPFDFGFVLSE